MTASLLSHRRVSEPLSFNRMDCTATKKATSPATSMSLRSLMMAGRQRRSRCNNNLKSFINSNEKVLLVRKAKPTQTKPRVHFATTASVIRRSASKEDLEQSWYQPPDYSSFAEERRKTVVEHDKGAHDEHRSRPRPERFCIHVAQHGDGGMLCIEFVEIFPL